jgi:S1-C subfamily serine protease
MAFELSPDGPAVKAAVKERDIIVGFKNDTVGSVADLHRLLMGSEIGRTSRLAVLRDNHLVELEVTPEEAG